jgi:hypothetical protein
VLRAGPLRVALVALAGALSLLAPASLSPTSAAFTATTADPANRLAADALQPPSGLTATQSCTVTPAVTHRTPTTATGTTSISLAVPTGTTAGDILLAHVAYRSGAATITTPSGWTRLLENTSGTQVTSAVYWKTATSSETSAVFSRPAGSSGDMAGGLVAYTGAHLTAPVSTYGGATGTGVTATTPSLTTTATTVAAVHFLTKRQEDLPVPAGTTPLYQGMSGTGTATEGLTASDETVAGPGVASHTSTSTAGFSAEWIAQTVVLRRAAGTPSAVLSWTDSSSTWASGYVLDRVVGGAVLATRTVTPVGTRSTTDGPLVDGTAYTFRLTTYQGTWRSTTVTVSLTPAC